MEDGPQFQQVPIDRIDELVPNPRRRLNPNFQRIKASIRAVGVRQPLHLIRRGKRFGLAYGGHSRLRALTELRDETGDARFSTVPALISTNCPRYRADGWPLSRKRHSVEVVIR